MDLAFSEIKSKFNEYEMEWTKPNGDFFFFVLSMEKVSSIPSPSTVVCYPASIEKEAI